MCFPNSRRRAAGDDDGAIARALNYDPPDADSMLGALADRDLVEKDTSVYPQVYRLSPALLGGAAAGSHPDG